MGRDGGALIVLLVLFALAKRSKWPPGEDPLPIQNPIPPNPLERKK